MCEAICAQYYVKLVVFFFATKNFTIIDLGEILHNTIMSPDKNY